MPAKKPETIVKSELQKVIKAIRVQQAELGIVDSGRSAASLRVVTRGNDLVISGQRYLETNFDGIGRPPGKPPPAQAIMQWGKLTTVVGQTRLQAAFAVAHTIGEFGTLIYPFNQGKQGIDIEGIVAVAADSLAKELLKNEVERANDIFIKLTQ